MIKTMIKTMNVGFVFLLLMSLVSAAHHQSHQVTLKEPYGVVVIEFKEQRQGNTKVLISQHDESGVGAAAASGDGGVGRRPGVVDQDGAKAGFSRLKQLFTNCMDKLATTFKKSKNVVSSKAHELKELAVEKVGDLTGKLSAGVNLIGEKAKDIAGEELSEKISHGVASGGEKAKEVTGNAKTTIGDALGDRIVGVLKDYVVKVEKWDAIDSPKRIGEDIESNLSRKFEQGTDEVKETIKNVKETNLNELFQKLKKLVRDVFLMFSLENIIVVISWCHLLGFSTAYGMGVWFTFVSSCVLGKCLPKRESGRVMNKMYMVYFRAMAYCVGGALIGYLGSQRRKGIVWNKMEMFQGFNLLFALFMILINLIFMEPQATKLMVERNKIKEKDGKTVGGEKEGGWNEKLKKLNAYSSTLNVSTLVVLTWHLAYIGQLLQTRDD